MTILLLFMFSSFLPLNSQSVGESTAYTVSSDLNFGENSLLNMLDVQQKELTELKAKNENNEREKLLFDQNIKKIQTNHQEEIKKLERKYERNLEQMREEYEEKIRSCSAPTTTTTATTTSVPHTNRIKAAEPQKCSAKVPGGRCLLVGDGECWCEDARIEDCSCNKPGGCPKGQYGEHAGWELCGYEEGYEGTYFPATKEAAEVFGYRYGNNPSCAKNSLYWGSVTPLSCPKHEQHCKNGFCSWLTQKDAWNKKNCGVQVCCTAFVRCTNMEEASTIKTTTESNYQVTPLPPMDSDLKKKLPPSSKMIYLGEGWKYFKIPIPAGNFKITGPKIAEVCKQYGMEAPCPGRKSCYKQKQCVETAHTTGGCTSNMIDLQTAITRKGYKSTDKNHLQYTFVYSHTDKDKDGVDGACGYWPGYYCHQGEKTESDGVNKFALCAIQFG